jgi:hypothetical protein
VLLSGFDGVTGMVRAFITNARQALAPPNQVRYGSFVPESPESTESPESPEQPEPATNGAPTNGHSTPKGTPKLQVRLIGRVIPGSVVKARVHS